MIGVMVNKTRPDDGEVAACILAGAVVVLCPMVEHVLRKNLTGK
jgi:hypothetical protein